MRLDKMLGIKYPFIQGGMANIATGEFAAAVSNAGGLGLIGAGGMNTDMLRENIRKCRTLTDKPFGVNLMLMNPEADAMAELLVEENVKIVTTGAGSPAKYMEKWKSDGMMVIPVVSSAALAIRMERFGADAVVAEGTESGGHVGEMTTMTLVPKVVARTFDFTLMKFVMPCASSSGMQAGAPATTRIALPPSSSLTFGAASA